MGRARRRRAVLARDRLGIKPLYHARSSDLLVFASELKSLLASGLVEPELDYEAIDAYLTFGFVPGADDPARRRLEADAGPRSRRRGRLGAPRALLAATRRRWLPCAGTRASTGSCLDKLDESVRLRLMSDVPLGAMLSGGIDSSLIVALMARHMSEPVKTFSVGFAEAGAENELEDARHVAEFFGTDHHELELSFANDTVDLEELVWHLDEPLADLSALGFLALSELASRHVTVALSGQGADELFGGYTKHRAAALAGAWRNLPGPIRTVGDRLAPHAPRRLRRAARTLAAPDAAERLLAMSGKVEDDLRGTLLRGPLAQLDGGAARRACSAGSTESRTIH